MKPRRKKTGRLPTEHQWEKARKQPAQEHKREKTKEQTSTRAQAGENQGANPHKSTSGRKAREQTRTRAQAGEKQKTGPHRNTSGRKSNRTRNPRISSAHSNPHNEEGCRGLLFKEKINLLKIEIHPNQNSKLSREINKERVIFGAIYIYNRNLSPKCKQG